jgi:hypothetical protein
VAGIHKSADEGSTWRNLGRTPPHSVQVSDLLSFSDEVSMLDGDVYVGGYHTLSLSFSHTP